MRIVTWLQNIMMDGNLEYITIETLDNPGWIIKFATNYNIQNSAICGNEILRSEDDWISVSCNETSYTFMGGAKNLIEICVAIHKMMSSNSKIKVNPEREKLLKWLEKWFFFNCDGDWEHDYGIDIIHKGSLWEVKIDLCNMAFALDGMPLFEERKSPSDYFRYTIENEFFIGEASNDNLEKLLKVFKTIVTKNEKKDGYVNEFYNMKEFTRQQLEYRKSLDEEDA